MCEEEDESAAFVAQRRSRSELAHTDGALSSAESLLCTSWSTHHHLLANPKRQPKSLPVGGHIDLQGSGFPNRGIQARIGRVE